MKITAKDFLIGIPYQSFKNRPNSKSLGFGNRESLSKNVCMRATHTKKYLYTKYHRKTQIRQSVTTRTALQTYRLHQLSGSRDNFFFPASGVDQGYSTRSVAGTETPFGFRIDWAQSACGRGTRVGFRCQWFQVQMSIVMKDRSQCTRAVLQVERSTKFTTAV